MGPTVTRRRRLQAGRLPNLIFVFLLWRCGAAITTVVPSDIRGLGTGLPWFRRGAASHCNLELGHKAYPSGLGRGFSNRGRAPPFQETLKNRSLKIFYAATSTVRKMAHMNAANSLAMAVVVTCTVLPLAVNR